LKASARIYAIDESFLFPAILASNQRPSVQALPHKIEGNLKKSDTKDLQDASGFDLWIGSDSIDE
jgi:hypothetical protein